MITEETGQRKYMGSNTVDAVKHHPGSAALVGIGIGWILYESMKMRPTPEERAPEDTQAEIQSREYVSEAKKNLQQAVEEKIKPIRERVSHLKGAALEKTRPARERVAHAVEEKQWLVGVIGLSAGIVIGMASSHYLRESRFMNETKENLKQKTRGILQGTREKAGHVLDAARQAAREEAERQHLITH